MTVVLVHGVGGDAGFWHDVAPLLPEAVAVSLPFTAEATIASLAQWVLAQAPGPLHLVGHSLGGMVAQEAALAEPDRVRSLALCNTIPGATPRVTAVNEGMATIAETEGLGALLARTVPALFAPVDRPTSAAARERLLASHDAVGVEGVVAGLRAITRWSAVTRLAALDLPALVVAGEHEPNLADQRQLAELLRARFEVVAGTGHMSPAEAPVAVATLIRQHLSTVDGGLS